MQYHSIFSFGVLHLLYCFANRITLSQLEYELRLVKGHANHLHFCEVASPYFCQ